MAHLKIIGQHQIAVIQQNSGLILAFEPLCRESGEARALARQAVKDHEAAAHGERAVTHPLQWHGALPFKLETVEERIRPGAA